MKKKLVVIFSLFLFACSNNADQSGVKPNAAGSPNTPVTTEATTYNSYSPAQCMELIQQKKDLLIIDVRSPEELREGKIENSTLIPFMDIMRGNYTIPQDRPLLLICAVGGRSYAAMQILAHKGYKEIYNLQGGIAAWKQANLPLVY
ncbi:MAG: rhodanese-like domain-containing protein [Desulfobulbaceae bacterium]|nr:rhodanese-like domain-containing protein [Desulfobulbaceae bacterium]